MPMPNIERHEPPYMQIVRHIREQIVSGELSDGDTIPSARQITRDWDVAMATATKALNTLRAEGLVRGVPGVGTVVQGNTLHRSAHDRTAAVLRTGRIYPPGHYAQIIGADLVPAPEHVANALQLDTAAPVIRRRRVTYSDRDTPLSASVSWFDGALASSAPLLLQADRIVQGTARYLEEQTGRTHARKLDKAFFSAAGASDDEANDLGIPEGAPVLRGRNFYRDSHGEVLEYGESVALEGLEVTLEVEENEE